MDWQLVLSGGILLALGTAVFLRPWFGLILLVFGSAFGKLARVPDLNWDIADVSAVTTVWSALVYLSVSNRKLRFSRMELPVLFLALAIVSNLPRAADQLALISAVRFLAILFMFFVGVRLLDNPTKVKLALAAVPIAGGLIAAMGVVLYATGTTSLSVADTSLQMIGGGWGESRVGGPFEQPNVFAQIMAVATPIGLAFALFWRGYKQWLLAALTSASLICGFLTQSRSAILGAVVGSLIVLHFSRRGMRSRIPGILMLVLLAGGIAAALGTSEQWFSRFSGKKLAAEYEPEARLNRRSIMEATLTQLWNHPWGVGYGQGHRAIGTRLGVTSKSAHNVLLSWGVELGVLGLLAGVWLIVRQISTLWRATRGAASAEARLLAAGCLGAVVATWIHNMFHSTLHSGYVWVFFAAASALCLLQQQQTQAAAEPIPVHRPAPVSA